MKKLVVATALALAGLGMAGLAMAQGGKPSVGVAEFKNESGAAWWQGGVGWELSGMLPMNCRAPEFPGGGARQARKVLEEQNLAASGRVRSGSGAQIGQLTVPTTWSWAR